MQRFAALIALVFLTLVLVPSASASSVSGAFVSIGADQSVQADPTPHSTPTTPSSVESFGYTICADPSTFPQNCGPGSPQEGAGQPPDGYVVSCDSGFAYRSYSAFQGTLTGLGTTTVTCHAYDPNGVEVGTATTTFTVVDATAPAVPQHGDVYATTHGNHPVAVTYDVPTATDNVDGTRTVTCDQPSGSLFPIGQTLVTCSASDLSGNVGATAFYVVVTKQ